MRQRHTTLFFAPLTGYESLRLMTAAPMVLLTGAARDQQHRTLFEEQWCRTTGASHAVATPSARSGLYALLEALAIGPGDEVLVTGFTCEAVPEPIQFRGARPIYIDIDLQRFAMDPSMAGAAVTPRTRALIIQHTFGLPAPTDALVALARHHGLAVIEDCALALGSRIRGRWLGTAADAAVFSFELSKTLTAGWGGIVQFNGNADLAARVRAIRDRAGALSARSSSRRLFQAGSSGLLYRPRVVRFSSKVIGAFFRLGMYARSATVGGTDRAPPNYLAAPAALTWQVLSRQLTRLPQVVQRRLAIAARYEAVLARHGGSTLVPGDGEGVTLIRFPLLVRQRERFARQFAQAGIETGRWFSQPVSCSGGDMSRYGYSAGSCPTAEFAASHIVNLPMHERMSDADIEAAVRCLDGYFAQFPEEREFMRQTARV